ncbi:Cna B-type domain-containing protein [Flavonifractor sp. An100]|uniref:Cna B-type domain-containing protein n=1 Tax=Flavonifractor sp. An100 TaxID=1965538 RepID=UPI000B38619B|nr:Cna B-type domain-containing protein [Flavonifractor sp. An100]OUQ81645.1 hypothetical protein B5E43_01820 [Flavonifractor sp. An100]
MVILSNVPSGHTYVLKETDTADDNYLVSDKEYTVNVSWGNANVANPDGKITADNENGYIFDGDLFLNKLDPQSKDLKVTKTWLPSSQGANVTSIALVVKGTITLNDGTTDVVYENTHTITGDLKATEWTATIKDLPTVDQETGKPISYTVSEVPSTSYKLTSGGTVTPDGNNLAVTLTNQITDTKELTIIKDWGGLDERYRTEVTVGLFANHTLKQEIKLNSSNGWSQKVTVDTYSGDEPITYTIAEKDGSKWVTSGTIVLDGTTFTVATDQNSYTITNTPVQQYTESLSGQKTWVDGDDENSTRPDSITVNLMVGTVKVASKTVTSANGWGYSWTGLPKFAVEDARDTTGVLAALKAAGYSMDKSVLTYTVQEEAVSGYTPTQDGNNFTNTISDINECEYVEVTKVWEDDSNSSDTRPDEIVLILSGNGQSYEIPFAKNEFYETDSVTKQTLEPVPKYNTTTGKEIIYTVSEKGVDSSKMKLDGKDVVYSVEYDQNTLTVTNSLDNSSDTVKVRVEKVWMDGANGDKTRPASIDVTVAGETVTLDGTPDQNGEIAAWVAEFTLPRFDDSGKAISYTVSDVSESGDLTAYQTGEVAATSVDGYDFAFTLTNKLVQKYFAIDVSKTWNTSTGITWTGFAAQANKPASVSVTISGDGKTYPLTLNEENGWAASQNSLPKYDSQGAAIAYTVSEVTVNGYNVSGGTLTPVLDANQNPTGDYTVAFANAFNQQFTKVSGQKIWNDGNSTANRPASITVGLYANDTLVATKPVSPNAEGKWLYSFENLPVYSNWTEVGNTTITYTVKEMDGDTPVVNDGSITYGDYTYKVNYTGSDITNTRTSDGGSASVQYSVNKVWIGPATADVAFGLYQNGSLIETISGENMVAVMSNETVWSGLFSEQPKYDANGNAYTYEVKELGDNNTAVSAGTGDQDITIGGTNYTANGQKLGSSYVFTNTVEQEYISISGEKLWVNAEGKTPDSIYVDLYTENGAPVLIPGVTNPIKVTPDSNGKWSYTFENLPKYALANEGDGHEIRYEVKEWGVDATGTVKHGDHYFTVSGGKAEDNYNITNTYKDSDKYSYYVVVNYVTHYSDGSADKVEGEFIYQQSTPIAGGSTATITPPATLDYDDNTFTFDADNSGNVISLEIKTPGTYKLVMWYERTEEVKPDPDPDSDPDPSGDNYYYRIDYVYTGYDADGNEIYSDEVTGSVKTKGSNTHSFTANDTVRHDGYDFYLVGDSEYSANLDGTTRSDPYVFTVYYEFTNLDDEETPTTDKPDTDPTDPSDPGDVTDLGDEDVPLSELPDEDVPKADVPATGDNLMVWVMAAAVSGIGLVWLTLTGKKRKEDEAI